MQFIFDEKAGEKFLIVENETYKYLFKVRRHKLNENINFRNLIDKNIYKYKIVDINKKEAKLELKESSENEVISNRHLEIAWCMIEPKIIEKNLPYLNEIGVSKISFIYCERSQKNFKLNFERLKNILINSNIQCGRTNLMEFEVFNSLKEFISKRDNLFILDFCDNKIEKNMDIKTILIGSEGGFSENEREKLNKFNKVGFDTNLILRSETAVVSIASKILI